MKSIRVALSCALLLTTGNAWAQVGTACSQELVIGNALARIMDGGVYLKSEGYYDGWLVNDNTSYNVDALVNATSCSTHPPEFAAWWGVSIHDDSASYCDLITVTTTVWRKVNGVVSETCTWTDGTATTKTWSLDTCAGGLAAQHHLAIANEVRENGNCETEVVFYHVRVTITDGTSSSTGDSCVRTWSSADGCDAGSYVCHRP